MCVDCDKAFDLVPAGSVLNKSPEGGVEVKSSTPWWKYAAAGVLGTVLGGGGVGATWGVSSVLGSLSGDDTKPNVVEKIVEVEKPVEVEKIVEKIVEVPVEKIVKVPEEKIVKVPTPTKCPDVKVTPKDCKAEIKAACDEYRRGLEWLMRKQHDASEQPITEGYGDALDESFEDY